MTTTMMLRNAGFMKSRLPGFAELVKSGLSVVTVSRNYQISSNLKREFQYNRNGATGRDKGYYSRDNSHSFGRHGGRFARKAPVEDKDPDSLDAKNFTKVVVMPKLENEVEVTLDQLKDENIIDTMLHLSISRMGFPNLTAVQQKTIKPILENEDRDVIARAKTGTGKTFAFLIPLFEHLIRTRRESPDMVKAVVLAPTRDLALQIEQEVHKIHSNNYALKKFGCMSVVGGTKFGQSLFQLKKTRPNIIIATPGRFIATVEAVGAEYFKHVDFKVLDEADRLLEIGFKDDLEYISTSLNGLNDVGKDHIRTLLFSATLDEKVQTLADDVMNKSECLFLDTVDKNEPESHEKIEQSLVVSQNFAESTYAVIDHLLKQTKNVPNYKAILFTPTIKATKFLSNLLKKSLHRYPVYEFHGKIDQAKRTRIVGSFKGAPAGLLVCTDVGARGMDFPNVTEVLQLGVPSELSNYVHRIGRTARGGKEGASVIFLSDSELGLIENLEKEKNISIENKSNYEPSSEIMENVEKLIESEEELADVLISVISFYRGNSSVLGLDENKAFMSIASSYGTFLKDPTQKIPIYNKGMLEKIGLVNNTISSEMFDLKGDASDHMERLAMSRSRSPNRKFSRNKSFNPSNKYGNYKSNNYRNFNNRDSRGEEDYQYKRSNRFRERF
ncbi:hypothetical protein Kpol_340p2 [Vanderwaltozyma polyspora DSM 70294]|uniref:ATP-dependent RNA helicase n=1 Tax=Vanderwaltozyma polyspora (strain ATCC 22028 / DSM 70294 / BCRC 21397 / CBS 2163 / NBRC 10782 / NRRL Y-8283 / UCD 57-17) TaxID=436907 RepID=A7TSU7_VANPO|nr:uncharacterized protein Kpol_340p2 [Vanderwaltozyma polyspora DSM 70294]EDO14655.1 hypothetical protein Kpol_340p2 [Vanderwaltozyma polyspora DSM 70294]